MNLYTKLGRELVARLDALNKKKSIVAIRHQQNGALVILDSGEMISIEDLSSDETTRLSMYLGFKGCGKEGLETLSFAPHLKLPTASSAAV